MARESSTRTRRKILDVALELFTSQGYDRTSLREIAERLGFSKAALYYHFPAKEDILVALAGNLVEEIERITRAAAASTDRSLAARARVIGAMVDLLLDNRATAELLLSEHQPVHTTTDLGARARQVLQLARQSLMPAQPTAEDRVRVAAALGVIQSTLDNLSDISTPALRDLVVRLAVYALDRDEGAVVASDGDPSLGKGDAHEVVPVSGDGGPTRGLGWRVRNGCQRG